MQRRRGRRRRGDMFREEYGYVLDYKPYGIPFDKHPWHRSRPVVQLIGDKFFTLMEASPRPGVELETGERVYVGPITERRDKIIKIDSDIEYEDLTDQAKAVLPEIVERIVREKEDVFVEFFNIAGPINLRFHSLELLSGIGKRNLMKILEAREKEPFKSYEDVKKVIHIDPVKMLAERILEEIRGGQKYYLFVRPPRREREQPVPPVFLNYLGKIYGSRKRAGAGEEGGAEA